MFEVDFEPFIIVATAAAAALAGFGIASTISALGGLGPALALAGGSFQAFALTARTAIFSIPVAGWVAAGVSALGALSISLLSTADSEEELAEKRKQSAAETIELIKAEKKRV